MKDLLPALCTLVVKFQNRKVQRSCKLTPEKRLKYDLLDVYAFVAYAPDGIVGTKPREHKEQVIYLKNYSSLALETFSTKKVGTFLIIFWLNGCLSTLSTEKAFQRRVALIQNHGVD